MLCVNLVNVSVGVMRMGINEILDKVESNSAMCYDKSGDFIASKLAEQIEAHVKVISMLDNSEMYWFDELDGLWKPEGEEIVRLIATTILGDEAKAHYCNEAVYYIKTKNYRERSVFNPPLNEIPLKNGILDIENMELRPYTKLDFFTTKLSVNFDPSAKCERFTKFLDEVMNDDDHKELLKEVMGYCMYRDYPLQTGFMFIGSGANGKSVILNLLKKMLGDSNVVSISIQDLEIQRFAKGQLYQKYANIYPDLSTKALTTTGTFKQVTGGDNITAEKKFKGFFNFYNYAKMIFSCNQIPIAYDDTDAYFRRWIILNFPNTFEGDNADPQLITKLTKDSEMSGVLNLILPCLQRLLTHNKFTYKLSTDQKRELYKRLSDPVEGFVMDEIDISPSEWIPKKELYKIFCDFCKRKNLSIVAENTFGKRLIRIANVRDYRPKVDGQRIYAWAGIKLRENDQSVSTVSGLSRQIPILSLYDSYDNKIRKNVDIPDIIDTKPSSTPTINYSSYENAIMNICNGNSVKVSDLLEKFESEEIAQKVLDKLIEKGEIFQVKPGVVRRV